LFVWFVVEMNELLGVFLFFYTSRWSKLIGKSCFLFYCDPIGWIIWTNRIAFFFIFGFSNHFLKTRYKKRHLSL